MEKPKDNKCRKEKPEDNNDGTKFRNLRYYFREYCQNTSIHGFRYLADSQRRLRSERIWWIFSIFVSLVLCITLITKIYMKWQNSPVIVSFATEETPIWQTPFPVITICPETKSLPNKFDYEQYLDMKKENHKLKNDEENKFGLIALLCRYDEKLTIKGNFTGSSEDILSFYEEVQPNFFKMISECKFMAKDVNCSEIFVPVITDAGICYSFNLLDKDEIYKNNVVHYKNFHSAPRTNWTLENGYSIHDGRNTYPRRALFAGIDFSLEAKFTVFEDDLDYVCGSSVQGFKMDITHPSRVPRPKFNHIKIPLDQAVMVTLLLDMMSTSEAVKNYNPRRRNCYMPDERPLKYFKKYTQQNCKQECLTNYTKTMCGCTSVYMPREQNTRICNGMDYHCVYLAEMDMLNASLDGNLLKLKGIKKSTKCDCLPICSKMNYNTQSAQMTWYWQSKYSNNSKGKHMSMIQVFFKDNQFITSERNELFGPIDFVANLGGLLGLFIGFSLLSLMEIIYYFTLRLCANIKLFGRENWSGQ